MYNEASMVVNENGKITLTIELKNQVFELLQVKDGKIFMSKKLKEVIPGHMIMSIRLTWAMVLLKDELQKLFLN